MKNIWQIGHKYKVELKDMEEKKRCMIHAYKTKSATFDNESILCCPQVQVFIGLQASFKG